MQPSEVEALYRFLIDDQRPDPDQLKVYRWFFPYLPNPPASFAQAVLLVNKSYKAHAYVNRFSSSHRRVSRAFTFVTVRIVRKTPAPPTHQSNLPRSQLQWTAGGDQVKTSTYRTHVTVRVSVNTVVPRFPPKIRASSQFPPAV